MFLQATATVLLSALVFLSIQSGHLGWAKQCYYKTNGTCLNLDDTYCPAGHKVEDRGCGFKESCCYPTVQKQPTFRYGSTQCGITSHNWKSKIVGGDEAYISEFPWMASIQKSRQPVCGGSIISDQWILTAAHCVETHSSAITVVVGTSKTRIAWDDYTESHQVSNILKHSRFLMDHASIGYDIALLKLAKPLNLGGTLTRSICLPEQDEDFTDHVCVASGWGYTHEPVGPATSDGGSPILKKATLPIISRNRCVYYTGSRSVHTMCAGYTSGGEDTCQGDSGGPLICKGRDGVWKQAGIVSTGRGCGRANAMGIYTQVSAYIDWINYAMKKY